MNRYALQVGWLVGWLVRRRPVMITEMAGSFRALTVKLVN